MRTGAPLALLPRAVAMLAVLGLLLMAMVGSPTTASAAANAQITVSDVTVVSQDNGQATIGDTLVVSGAWDASAADPKPGDTFTIKLPVELNFHQSFPFNLLGGDGVAWGSCLTDPDTRLATCTLSNEVIGKPEEVMGTFTFEVKAVKDTKAEDVVFELNGTPTKVDLPGTGGISDGVVLPVEWKKSGKLAGNKWRIDWTIELPGSELRGPEPGRDSVTILEDLNATHALCTPIKAEMFRGSTSQGIHAGVKTNPGAEEPDFSIVLTGPFRADVTYRLTYSTCTVGNTIHDAGTQYTNEATVQEWGQSSGVIGVGQDFKPDAAVRKTGSVLGGGNRNGVIGWTVTVEGNHVQGTTPVQVTDTLSGQQALCTDASGARTLRGLRITQQYGPSGEKQQVLDAATLARSVATADTSFSLTLTPQGSFTFEPSPYRYIIYYETCSTIDGLPAQGTQFTNAVTVNSVLKNGSAVVPGRTEGKSGSINTKTTVVDGESYYPQTTMGWTITVPGERLKDFQGDLTVSDTLTATHEVCGAGDDIARRMNLRVEAQDQIGGGGLGTKALPATASIGADAKLSIQIPAPQLPLPGGGTATGFSKEYQYVITYTTCTTSGGMDAPGTSYGNSAEVAGKTYTTSFTQQNSGSGTGQGVTRGSVAVLKGLTGAGTPFVPAGTAFSVKVKEIDPAGVERAAYTLSVPVDGTPVSGPNSRGRGWTVELSEPTFPKVPGVTFGAPVFTASEGVTPSADGTTAVAALQPKLNVIVRLTNTAQLGSVVVAKALEGPAADLVAADQGYPVTATIDTTGLGKGFPGQPDRSLTVKPGAPVTLDGLPIGAVVRLSEQVPADDDTLTWAPARFTPNELTVTAEHAVTPAKITVTNSVTRTVGGFTVAKQVTGAEADNPAVPGSVVVTATWQQDGERVSKTLTLPTDGTAVDLGERLLIGTEVTLTETRIPDGSGIAWGAPVWSGTGVSVDGESAVVTIGRDAEAAVTLTNHAATSTAGISLLKGVAGEAAEDVPADATFPVTATWTDAEGEHSVDLSINANEPTPLGVDLPAGTVITLAEGERPTVDTVVWGGVTFSGERVETSDEGVVTVVVSDQQDDVTLITVLNETTWAPGTFTLSKHVTGVLLDDPDVPETVTVVATWLDEEGVEQSTELSLPTDGTAVPFGRDLPHLTEVTLTEIAPENSVAFTWDAPQWDGERTVTLDDGSAVVTISAADDVEVALTNHATATLASLELTKSLTGDGADLVPVGTEFPVTAHWVDLMGEEQQVSVDLVPGEPTVIEGLPVGTQVWLTEHEVLLPGTVEWVSLTWVSDDENLEFVDSDEDFSVVLGPEAAPAHLDLINEFEALPEPEVPEEPTEQTPGTVEPLPDTGGEKPTPGLPSTGFGPGTAAGIVGSLAVAVLGALMILRRTPRRRNPLGS